MNCPECGDRVPFGGGKTIQNASLMVGMYRVLSDVLDSGELSTVEAASLNDFLWEGEQLSIGLHEYGHKRTMTKPNWATAGLWSRQAAEMIRDLGLENP
jgi:hypothetical protein